MAATTLVEPRIDAGRQLLVLLRGVLNPFAALWYWDPDAEKWRFIVGTRLVDESGPREAYRLLREVMSTWSMRDKISIDEVVLAGERDPLLSILKDLPLSGLGGMLPPVDISGRVLGGKYVEGGYVYLNARPQRHSMRG